VGFEDIDKLIDAIENVLEKDEEVISYLVDYLPNQCSDFNDEISVTNNGEFDEDKENEIGELISELSANLANQ
jgi:hypothetical protein